MKREMLIQLIIKSPLNSGWTQDELDRLTDNQLEEIYNDIRLKMGGDPT